MNPNVPWWLHRNLTTAWAIVAAVLVVSGASGQLRVAVVVGYLLFVPGACLLRRLLPGIASNPGPRLLLATALSLMICIVVGEGMVLIRLWQPEGAALAVVAVAELSSWIPRKREERYP